MKVIPKSTTCFSEVKKGEVFKVDDGSGQTYMRIRSVEAACSNYVYNTVHLETGNIYGTSDDTKVVIVDGAFVEGSGLDDQEETH